MRLQSIIIDGFKSYAHRQELGNLDAHFNAITGLNGSGKSNIFDAICFVMGISNLKKVRAEDPSELIFKNGQAGIQRASVTIEFLNNDPRTAPQGFSVEEFPLITVSRQIITGGRQKFFLNGRVSDQGKVKQFFHACNLNVDNPHFLVLQGTVHKLVNMRPNEILGLLEEAAGTRVFDARRRNAENMIIGKEKKVEQLNQTIDAEIGPMLLTMKDEQEALAKYVAIVENLESMKRFRTAHGYWVTMMRIQDAAKRLDELKRTVSAAQQELKRLPATKRDAEARLASLKDQLEAPTQLCKDVEERQAAARKEQAAANFRISATQKNLRAATKAAKALDAELATCAQKLQDFMSSADDKKRMHLELRKSIDTQESELEQLKESIRLQRGGIRAGLNGMTLEEEFNALTREVMKLKAASERYHNKIAQLRAEATQLQTTLSQTDGANDRLEKEILAAQIAATKAENEYNAVAPAFDKLRDAEAQAATLRRDLQLETEKRHQAAGHFALQYNEVPGYDFAGSIFGRVGELVRVKQPELSAAISAGVGAAKLFRVVVTDDEITQALIDKGRLRSRTTFLPLNIKGGPTVDQRRLDAAADVATAMGGWAKCAADLVSYDQQFDHVLRRQFADVIVCSDIEVAKAIANDRRCGLKCVTPEADIVEPTGAMTGGSKSSVRDYLRELAHYNASGAEITAARTRVQDAERRLKAAQDAAQHATLLRAAAEEAQSRVAHLQNEQRGGRGAEASRRLDQVQKDLAETAAALKTTDETLAARKERLADVESAKTDDPAVLERKLQERQAAAEKRLAQSKREYRDGLTEFQTSESHRNELEQRKRDLETEIEEKKAEVSTLETEERTLTEQVQRLTQEVERLGEQLTATQAQLKRIETSCEESEAEIKRIIEEEHELNRRVKEHEGDIRTFAKTQDDDKKALVALERTHTWLAESKDQFGPANGEFFFDDHVRTEQALQLLKESEATVETMGRKVNRKVNMMFEACKQEYDDLKQKRETLKADRNVILESIKEVEEHKWATLDALVAKVSEGFSKLFAACLPHASARLVEERESSTGRLTGVAVKVAFNGKEKESLTELSGGQRSLLALCLILAILRFRPAPVYILDEVDAALDPSHTQNIGKMLKEHFADAQFLLVSLKDGMFNNANVIYQVRNTQGYSEVTRVVAQRR